MKTYVFNQNNSGGGYLVNTKTGVAHYVVLQSENFESALRCAEDIGLYFNGVEDGVDCECCGDRWTYPDEYNSLQEAISSLKSFANLFREQVAVHSPDGNFVVRNVSEV